MISKEMGLSIEEFQKYYVRKGCAKGRDLGGSISCIYLLQLGKLGDLHKRFNITPFDKNGEICANLYDDNDIVYKYGRTDNLKKRLGEHKRNFLKYGITNIHIVYYARMDPGKLSVDLENEYRNHTRIVNKEMLELTTQLAVYKAGKKESKIRETEHLKRIKFLEKSLITKDAQLTQLLTTAVMGVNKVSCLNGDLNSKRNIGNFY